MAFPSPRYIETDQLRMAVYEAGEGFPVILCHGWPEIAYSWRHQLPALAAAGFRAIAPDQRGYGETGAPKQEKELGGEAAVPLYDMEHLTGDLVALLDTLEIEKAVFCGHDWGGFVVWQMPLHHPERVAGVIGVNTPMTPRAPADPIAIMRGRMGEDMYIVHFQKYGEADRILASDTRKSIRFLYRRPPEVRDLENPPEALKNFSFIKALQASGPVEPDRLLLTPEEEEVYVRAFEKTGWTRGINWYRNMTRNWERSAGLAETISCPCLMISAADDMVLRPELTEGMEKHIADLEKHIIPDCGHWTQAEQPEALNRLLTGWLTRRFGAAAGGG